MLNDLRSEERKQFSSICERQHGIYRFLGIPDTDDGLRQQPVNHIFKRFYDGRPVDFLRLRDILATRFVSQIRFAYEWFSLWKVFYGSVPGVAAEEPSMVECQEKRKVK